MDSHLIFLVLLAALCHALWNALIKQTDDKIIGLVGLQSAIVLLCLPLIFIFDAPQRASWGLLALSTCFHFGYYLSLAYAYRFGDFAHAYPIARGGAPLVVAAWGVLVLHETMNARQWSALGLIIGGILIFAARRLRQVLHERQALFGALLTAAFIGAYTISDGVGGRLSGDAVGYVVWLSLIQGAPMLAYGLLRRQPRAVWRGLRDGWRRHFTGAVLSLLAYALVVWSMSQTSIALVAALRETSIVIAALIGAYYFNEPSGVRRLAASVVVLGGVVLLAGA